MTPESWIAFAVAIFAVVRYFIGRMDDVVEDCERHLEQQWDRCIDHFAKREDVAALTAKVDAIDERTKEILKMVRRQ